MLAADILQAHGCRATFLSLGTGAWESYISFVSLKSENFADGVFHSAPTVRRMEN